MKVRHLDASHLVSLIAVIAIGYVLLTFGPLP